MILEYMENEKYFLLNKIIKIDLNDSLIIGRLKKINDNDSLIFDYEINLWVYKCYKSRTPLIEILYPDKKIISVHFLNLDHNDYREKNLLITEKIEEKIIPPLNYKILFEGEPYYVKEGKFAGQHRNMYWKVQDNNLTYYLIHIKDDIFTKVSKRDIKKILLLNDKRPSWYIGANGYVCATIRNNDIKKFIYLHQLILDVHDEDLTSFEKTVDHINCDKLDNRRDNLRLVNMSVQNANRVKSARRCDANELPDNLTQKDLPKYVIYRKEILDKETNRYREYFYIQNHPKLEKTWETTKSNKVSIREKLKLAKLKLEYLDEIISEAQYNKQSGLNKLNKFIKKEQELKLPKYFRLSNDRNRKQFIYDQKVNDKRQTLRMVLQSDDEEKELEKFIELVKEKYQ
jgi:hypothetical protein